MTVPTYNFTTGPSTLPDAGRLSYNGCVFSPLFETSVSGTPVLDRAERTVKYVDYVLTADGYVTLPEGHANIGQTMAVLRQLLSAQGGTLVYLGRGINLVVGPAEITKDVAWGPVPEVLEFQPLGGGKSAKIRWMVKTRITEVQAPTGNPLFALLQFNYETLVVYDEDGYSSLVVRGTMEIPMSRFPLQSSRTVARTVDSLRGQIETRVTNGLDLARFHVTRREFNISRDKRTMEWSITLEEKAYMDLPPYCTVARGNYSVRPASTGMGLVTWLCTLRATYTVRADMPRRMAWFAFLALLRIRMSASTLAPDTPVERGNQNPPRTSLRSALQGFVRPFTTAAGLANQILRDGGRLVQESRNAFLIDFSFDEGLYLDSRTVSFSATWRLTTIFSHILLASGLWKKLPEAFQGPPDPRNPGSLNLWAITMDDVQGSKSWLPNTLDPKSDIIVDFGGGDPPLRRDRPL